MIYPLPLFADGEICEELEDLVTKGINLLIIGDIASGPEKGVGGLLPGKAARFAKLCGIRKVGDAFNGLSKGRSLYMEQYLPKIKALPPLGTERTSIALGFSLKRLRQRRLELQLSEHR